MSSSRGAVSIKWLRVPYEAATPEWDFGVVRTQYIRLLLGPRHRSVFPIKQVARLDL
jgi:hypothetical protein